MKKILFVVNTMGRAGAELLNALKSPDVSLYLYVIMGQGEMIRRLPPHVVLLNKSFSSQSVLTRKGKRVMVKTICTAFFRNGRYGKKLSYILKNAAAMKKKGKIQIDKLLWRMLSDGSRWEVRHSSADSGLGSRLIWQLRIWKALLPIMWQNM